MNTDNKIHLEADIIIEKETVELREKASKIITLPKDDEKQQDLLYFSALFVSSGENLNHAYFLGSELIMAEGTIINKAMDVEHDESSIVGHIYSREYMDSTGSALNITELATMEMASQDGQEMHIAIAGVIYKNRFPNLADEVSSKKWKVSMECYYSNYDLKIGDLILTTREAEALGLAAQDENILGRAAKVIKDGIEIAAGKVVRVLRDICFSGCGFVKTPANPPSIVLETAKDKQLSPTDDVITLTYDDEIINVTSDTVEGLVKDEEKTTSNTRNDTVGICVSYKKRLYDKDENVVAEDWCTMYEKSCTSFSRDTTDVNCLRNKEILQVAKSAVEERFKALMVEDRREELLNELKAALSEAVKSNQDRRK